MTLSPATRFHIGGLLWNEWAVAHATLKSVKAENNDGSKDWAAFHAERLRAAEEAEKQTYARYLEFRPFVPEVL